MRTQAPSKRTHEQNDSRRLDGALVPPGVRPLNEPWKKIMHVPSLLTNHKSLVILAAIVVWFSFSNVGSAQEVADTIRVNTRVVFMDALVKDKRTGVPISDLKPENFEVLDDGSPRPITYFTREGQARKPLALVLILDLRADGAGRYLKAPGDFEGRGRRVGEALARGRSGNHGDGYGRGRKAWLAYRLHARPGSTGRGVTTHAGLYC